MHKITSKSVNRVPKATILPESSAIFLLQAVWPGANRVFVLAISDFAGGTRGQRAVQVKPWAGRKMGSANGMGTYLILTRFPNANSFQDTRIRPGPLFCPARLQKSSSSREI